MPISTEEWKKTPESSEHNPIHSSTGLKAEIAKFLKDHSDQGFTLTEIADNVDSPLNSGGTANGFRNKVKGFVVSAGEKRVVKYFLNQLVAEGHVQTRIRIKDGSETIYYRNHL